MPKVRTGFQISARRGTIGARTTDSADSEARYCAKTDFQVDTYGNGKAVGEHSAAETSVETNRSARSRAKTRGPATAETGRHRS